MDEIFTTIFDKILVKKPFSGPTTVFDKNNMKSRRFVIFTFGTLGKFTKESEFSWRRFVFTIQTFKNNAIQQVR
jgi:hypothetical protein